MLLVDLDATLARFGASVDTMTANLLELDANPTSKLLESTSLTGTTGQQVGAARQTLASLWEHFVEFKDLVERARQLRGNNSHVPPQRINELEALLTGPSITLPPIDVPLSKRGLYTPGQTPVATTPEELLASMGAAFDTAKAVILAVDDAWRSLVPRLSTAQEELAALTALAATLGESDAAIDRLRSRVDTLNRDVGNDPLAIDADGFAQVEATLASVRVRLDQLAADRQSLDRDLDGCPARLDDIRAALDEGERMLRETQTKILNPQGLLVPPDRGCLTDVERGLGPWLERLRRLSRQGDWRSACLGLAQWGHLADETLTTARQVAAANAAPLQARNELRGRLDALTAKADRLGLTENAELSALREQARTALFTAPTDLQLANRLVAEFGASMTAPRQ